MAKTEVEWGKSRVERKGGGGLLVGVDRVTLGSLGVHTTIMRSENEPSRSALAEAPP